AGYLVSVSFLPLTPGYLVSAFFLFRLFDILKPFPVGVIERRITGGLGIMLDDIAAGLITNLLLQIWRFF
ncbi:MAG: phosphatidylglycerophosphatase A, partial [Chloroflexota bacterium]